MRSPDEELRKWTKEKLKQMVMNQYSMIVQWSDEDRLFLVTIPEFADRVVMPYTHGKTREEVIRHGEEVLEMYLEAWQEEGEPIPAPNILQIA